VSAVDGVSAVDRVSAVDEVGGVDGTGGVDEGGGVDGVGGVGGEGGLSSEGARGPWWGARCGRRGQSGRPGGGASARPYGSRGVGAMGWLEWPPRCWGARRARRLGRPNRPPQPHPLAPRGCGGGAVGAACRRVPAEHDWLDATVSRVSLVNAVTAAALL